MDIKSKQSFDSLKDLDIGITNIEVNLPRFFQVFDKTVH
jgi:hypothetical protein